VVKLFSAALVAAHLIVQPSVDVPFDFPLHLTLQTREGPEKDQPVA